MVAAVWQRRQHKTIKEQARTRVLWHGVLTNVNRNCAWVKKQQPAVVGRHNHNIFPLPCRNPLLPSSPHFLHHTSSSHLPHTGQGV